MAENDTWIEVYDTETGISHLPDSDQLIIAEIWYMGRVEQVRGRAYYLNTQYVLFRFWNADVTEKIIRWKPCYE